MMKELVAGHRYHSIHLFINLLDYLREVFFLVAVDSFKKALTFTGASGTLLLRHLNLSLYAATSWDYFSHFFALLAAAPYSTTHALLVTGRPNYIRMLFFFFFWWNPTRARNFFQSSTRKIQESQKSAANRLRRCDIVAHLRTVNGAAPPYRQKTFPLAGGGGKKKAVYLRRSVH